MALYLFRAKDGSELERDYPLGKCPVSIKVKGKRYEHIWSSQASICCKRDIHFVSHQLPRHHKDAPAHDEKGRPLFSSRSEANRFAERNGYKYDEL